jgi:hypothetical protein
MIPTKNLRLTLPAFALMLALALQLGTGALAAEEKKKAAAPLPGACKVEEVFDEAGKITRIFDFDLGVVIYRQDGPSPSITAVPLAALNLENVARLEQLQEQLPAGCPRPL